MAIVGSSEFTGSDSISRVPDEVRRILPKENWHHSNQGTSDCYIRPGEREFNHPPSIPRRHNKELLRRFQGTPSPQSKSLRRIKDSSMGNRRSWTEDRGAPAPLRAPCRRRAEEGPRHPERDGILEIGDPSTQDQQLVLRLGAQAVHQPESCATRASQRRARPDQGEERLDTLFLSRTVVDDEGLAKLGTLLRNMKVLYLTGTRVTDRGSAFLAPLDKWKTSTPEQESRMRDGPPRRLKS
jgi:hypothetical protein